MKHLKISADKAFGLCLGHGNSVTLDQPVQLNEKYLVVVGKWDKADNCLYEK